MDIKPFGYFCDWGDYDGLQRVAMYYGEPGSGSIDDWNEYPKVHKNLPLYDQSALLQAREEGRREGMREAAEICGNLTFTTEISELIGMTKKQMAERACLECQKAITRASEGK